MFYTYPKNNQFSKRKNFLHLSEKLFSKLAPNFLYLREKPKAFPFRCVLNTLLIFIMAKLNRAFDKLIRMLVCPGVYI